MATIHDVAQLADVSIATVSRVLNGNLRVSEQSRQRVMAAASQLDYWPNGTARSLTTRSTRVLGVLLPDLYGEFFSEVIRGIDQAARAETLQVLLSSSHANTEAVLAAARSMRGRIDGLIMMTPDVESAGAVELIQRRFPVVLLNPRSPVAGTDAVSIANFEGARAVTQHLLDLGHTAIATIRGPVGNVDSDERLRGYHQAFRDAGLETPRSLELPGDFTEVSGYRLAAELLQRKPRPTAVFAANDSMAIGLLSALGSLGVGVPGDLSVVGFDDIAIARYMNPPLTTVRVDAYGLGQQAVRLMTTRAQAPASVPSRHAVLPAPLVVRRSCGSPAAESAPIGHPSAESVGPVHPAR
ncbi:MAG: LacI family DNA-binding transcriptional regulator [bacterium]